MSHRVETKDHGGRTVYTLRDESSGASASILPSYGFNLFDLRLPAGGEVRQIIVAADDFASNPTSPGRNGTPILFPFPNRIRDGKYSFGGKSYELPLGGKPHTIHGFAIAADWTVVEQGASENESFLVGRFHLTEDAPEMRPNWPADAVLEVRYALSGRKLTMTITVTNPTDQELPYGFGIHPYFRIPFASKDPKYGKVVIPASEYWPIDGNLPTGERSPVDARLDYREGQSMAGQKLDDVLTGVIFQGDHCVCRLIDEELGAEFRLGFDRHFREIVVFTPPFGEGTLIAVEPYTQTTDAINLQARGVDAGLRVLGHGKSESMVITMESAG
ncbi:aldose 1-epimerase [Tundrisphaera lichenicola]|uniref:aldose 1-epimerase n=1 Tax=Tundrisphaera lichenicola TaxID=2029860 RepID=UPI003EBD8C0B